MCAAISTRCSTYELIISKLTFDLPNWRQVLLKTIVKLGVGDRLKVTGVDAARGSGVAAFAHAGVVPQTPLIQIRVCQCVLCRDPLRLYWKTDLFWLNVPFKNAIQWSTLNKMFMFLLPFFISWTQISKTFTQKAYFSQILLTNLSKSVLGSTSILILPPHRCGISRCWLDSMIIAQVCLRLATIKGHS